MHIKYLIVGCGISGITIAQKISTKSNEDILIIDKRSNIGGNCFDCYNDYNILIHKYGPHIFHTKYKQVWDYLSQFTQWNIYQHKVLIYVDGQYIPMPINLDTINKLYNLRLSQDELEQFFEKRALKIEEINNSRDVVLSKIGQDLYEKFFMNYTKKQWDMYPEELDKSVISRVPIRNNRDSRYFVDRYQGMPQYGYTKMFEKMINKSKIHILLNTDYKDIVNDIHYDYLIYTAPIDYFFDYKYGKLKYRSLNFEFETIDMESYQDASVINYPNDYDFTRITEFKKLTGQRCSKTTILKEYPRWDGEPYYPVLNEESIKQYQLYKNEVDKLNNIFFIGRLAEYKYYNMDMAVKNALDLYESKIKYLD